MEESLKKLFKLHELYKQLGYDSDDPLYTYDLVQTLLMENTPKQVGFGNFQLHEAPKDAYFTIYAHTTDVKTFNDVSFLIISKLENVFVYFAQDLTISDETYSEMANCIAEKMFEEYGHFGLPEDSPKCHECQLFLYGMDRPVTKFINKCAAVVQIIEMQSDENILTRWDSYPLNPNAKQYFSEKQLFMSSLGEYKMGEENWEKSLEQLSMRGKLSHQIFMHYDVLEPVIGMCYFCLTPTLEVHSTSVCLRCIRLIKKRFSHTPYLERCVVLPAISFLFDFQSFQIDYYDPGDESCILCKQSEWALNSKRICRLCVEKATVLEEGTCSRPPDKLPRKSTASLLQIIQSFKLFDSIVEREKDIYGLKTTPQCFGFITCHTEIELVQETTSWNTTNFLPPESCLTPTIFLSSILQAQQILSRKELRVKRNYKHINMKVWLRRAEKEIVRLNSLLEVVTPPERTLFLARLLKTGAGF
jgi:hypothetical protein